MPMEHVLLFLESPGSISVNFGRDAVILAENVPNLTEVTIKHSKSCRSKWIYSIFDRTSKSSIPKNNELQSESKKMIPLFTELKLLHSIIHRT